VAVVATFAASASGCSSETKLVVTVEVRDTSVPFFTQIDYEITSVADPSHFIAQNFVTSTPGYNAEGGLPAVVLPQQQTFAIDSSFPSGQVLVDVYGVDLASGTFLARGAATATVVAKQEADVTVVLHGLGTGCSVDAGPVDSSAPCDGGADAAPRAGG
jgi:hypothetical protein